MTFEEFVTGSDANPSCAPFQTDGAPFQTETFALPVKANRRSVPVTVRRFASARDGSVNSWLRWHLYNLMVRGIPHLVFDFAPRTVTEWPALAYVSKDYAEEVCTFDPLDSRHYQLFGQKAASDATRLAQGIHVAEILIGLDSNLWPDDPNQWFVGWNTENLHALFPLYDTNYRNAAQAAKLVGGGKQNEEILQRWSAFFSSDAVLGHLYSDPHFVRALSAASPRTPTFYNCPLLFCHLDLSRLPFVDAKWMAEALLLGRLHHLHYGQIFHVEECPGLAAPPPFPAALTTPAMPMDATWDTLPMIPPAERKGSSVKTATACKDLHLVLIDHDAAIVNVHRVLDHALQTLPAEFIGQIFIYAQCGHADTPTSLPMPPETPKQIREAIYQLSRLKFGRDQDLCQAELRLSCRSFGGVYKADAGFEELPQMPSHVLLSELITGSTRSCSRETEVLHDIRARRNLQYDFIGEDLCFPLGTLEDVRFYLPHATPGREEEPGGARLADCHDLTEILRGHKFVTPSPLPSTAPHKPASASQKPASSSQKPASAAQESSVSEPRRPTSVPTARPRSDTGTAAPAASGKEPKPWTPGRVLAGAVNIRHHQIPAEKAFVLDNEELPDEERRLRTLDELSEAINLIDQVTFVRHVNAEKNDFAAWVESVFEEKELAEQLRKYPTPLRMMVSIEKFLRQTSVPAKGADASD